MTRDLARSGEAAAANLTVTIHTVDGHDLCRVHVRPSGFPVGAQVTVDQGGQLVKKTAFYVRLGNGSREITDAGERQRYVAARWGAGADPRPGNPRRLPMP